MTIPLTPNPNSGQPSGSGHSGSSSDKGANSDAPLTAREKQMLEALRSIQQMSLQAAKGPAHVAKLTLSMMADVADEAIAKATGGSS